MISKIDRAMVLRIQPKTGPDKDKTIPLRKITIPLIIFMLEHQFCSTIGEKGELTICNYLETSDGDSDINRFYMYWITGEFMSNQWVDKLHCAN